MYSSFLQGQVWSASAGSSGAATLSQGLQQILGVLSSGSVSTQIQQFFSGVAQVAANPSDIPSRQAMLGDAQTLSNTFQSLAQQLNQIGQGINQQMQQSVSSINQLSTQIAQLNQQIANSAGLGNGTPNDLLDQRDQLLTQLNAQVGVQVVRQNNSQINVFLSNGQALVAGSTAFSLKTQASPYNQQNLDIAYEGAQGSADITKNLSGGILGGLLQLRAQSLQPAENGLGLLADGIAAQVNGQQAQGLNLQGSSGTAIFQTGGVQIFANSSNSSGSSAAALQGKITNIGNLTGDEYILRKGASGYWQLSNASTGAVLQTTSGTVSTGGATSLNFSTEGFQVQVSGSVATGDRFLVEPTRLGAAGMQTIMSDPSQIAAASPYVGSPGVMTSGALVNNNLGNMTLSAGQFVSGSTAGAVQVSGLGFPMTGTAELQFSNGASSGSADFTITANGTTLASGTVALGSSGTAIDIAYPNDPPGGYYQMLLSGTLVGKGDTITISPGGAGSNGNAQAMAGLATQGIFNGGANNANAQAAQLLTQVTTQANQAQDQAQAQASVLSQAQSAQQSYSGVNLDQEAANLILYQQAYQAAAKAISVGNTLFQSLIQAL
ncbi:flagellar basal body rod C-terminal domain-containing protein [Acidithiobacillus sp. AMEEHan]|uniref:FlgK family flagellar hook-associated protein n=1 Tax=Acidithiobacillus sp. AMEEHan TaxID=2994951 RepID=UPI0027E4CA26|nr:flagellar basal body rod C-terminal domain-containing protein [Acidithiobacillus sp. AMEEHan]